MRLAIALLVSLAATPSMAAPKKPLAHAPRPAPPSKPVTGPLARFMRVLDVTLGDSTLRDTRVRVGPAQAKDNGGSGPAAVTAVCYAGKDGTALAFLAPTADAPVGEVQLAVRDALLDYSGSPGHAVDPDHRPACAALRKLRRATVLGGVLHLGMARPEVLRALGKPYSRTPKRLHYRAEFRPLPGPGAPAAAAGQTTVRFVELEFAGDRVVRIWAGQSAG